MKIQDLPADVRASFLAAYDRTDVPGAWQSDPESEALAAAQPDPSAYLAGIRLRQASDTMSTADTFYELKEDTAEYDELAAAINAKYGSFVIRSESGHGVYGHPYAHLYDSQRREREREQAITEAVSKLRKRFTEEDAAREAEEH